MKKNIGSVDKVIRLIIATVLVILTIAGNIEGTLAVLAMIIAVVLIVTSLVSFCPLWALFGINTKKNSVIKPKI